MAKGLLPQAPDPFGGVGRFSQAGKAPSGNAPPNPTLPAELAALLEQIRMSAAIQSERIQVIPDAAVLAAEQVQDKRIELLETAQRPKASFEITALWWLAGIVVLPVVGEVVAAAAGGILSSVLTSQAWALELLPTSEAGSAILGFTQYLPANLSREFIKNELSATGIQAYSAYVQKLAEGGSDAWKKLGSQLKENSGVMGDWLRDAAKDALSEAAKPGRKQRPAPSDTPGVTILEGAQTYASHHRFAIATHHAQIESAAYATSDPRVWAQLATAVDWAPLGEDLNTLRHDLALTYEAIIWIKLFKLDAAPSTIAPKLNNSPFTTVFLGTTPQARWTDGFGQPINDALVGYWASRFAAQIDSTSTDPMSRAVDVERYFTRLSKALTGSHLPDGAITVSQ